MNEAAESLRLGAPYHVGIVVRNLDEAMNRLAAPLSVERWGIFESEVPSVYRGTPTRAGSRAAYARTPGIYVELVEPRAGPWTASVFLEERGEGVYHLGYWVDDLGEALSRAGQLGLSVDWSLDADPGPIVAYLEPTFGVHIELVSSSLRGFIEQLFKDTTGAAP